MKLKRKDADVKQEDTTVKQSTISSEYVRCYLSYIVTIAGALAVLGLPVLFMLLANKDKRDDTAKLLLSSILPVLGTWVGTVLAYYFAKENFESAARAAERRVGIEEKLRSVPVTTAMIDIAKAETRKLAKDQDPESLKLKDLIDQMNNAKPKRHRLPVLDAKGAPVYVIHLSSLTDFVAQRALVAAGAPVPAAAGGAAPPAAGGAAPPAAGGAAPPAAGGAAPPAAGGAAPAAAAPAAPGVAGLTIADLENKRADLFRMISAWVCVPRTGTLADAKTAMEGSSNCSDVFVTESGRPDEPVIGWVTNVEIAFHSKA